MPRKVAADDPTRMYQSDLMERLTRSHPAEPFVIFVPLVTIALTPAQLSMLLEGIDWRIPQRTFQPHAAA